jgi:hypothetical protein
LKDLRSRLVESPEAAARPLPFRNAYEAHPFLVAAIPVLLGLGAWFAGAYLRIGILTVVGAGIAVFGIFIELLNTAAWVWRRTRRSRQ